MGELFLRLIGTTTSLESVLLIYSHPSTATIKCVTHGPRRGMISDLKLRKEVVVLDRTYIAYGSFRHSS